MSLWVAEVRIEPLEREAQDGPPLGQRTRGQMQEQVGLSGAVLACEQREHRPVHGRVREELVNGSVDRLLTDGHRKDRFHGRKTLAGPDKGAQRRSGRRLGAHGCGDWRNVEVIGHRQVDQRAVGRWRRGRTGDERRTHRERPQRGQRVRPFEERRRSEEHDARREHASSAVGVVDQFAKNRVGALPSRGRQVQEQVAIPHDEQGAAVVNHSHQSREFRQCPLGGARGQRRDDVSGLLGMRQLGAFQPSEQTSFLGAPRPRAGDVGTRKRDEISSGSQRFGSLIEPCCGVPAVPLCEGVEQRKQAVLARSTSARDS